MTVSPIHLRGRLLQSAEIGDVFVVDGRLTFESPGPSETIAEEGWIVPGLVDAHAHLALASPSNADSSGDLVRASARAHLDVGVLLIREPGGPDHSSSGISIHEDLPRVQSAGRFLAPPGGYFPGLAREVPASLLTGIATLSDRQRRQLTRAEPGSQFTLDYPVSSKTPLGRASIASSTGRG